MLEDAGVYAHFPWCVRKCPYCDFNSHPLKDDADFDGYVAAVLDDYRDQENRYGNKTAFASVFLGGGTPSLFAPSQLGRVLDTLPLATAAEVTMEANPGTTEHADFKAYRDCGVTRLSLGAQSFNDTHLQALGRIHSAAETHRAFRQARSGGFDNINIDIMWGLPDQSVDAALADLTTALALQPEHLSWYQLTIEPKTEFAQRTPLLPVEDTLYRIEQEGLALLAAAGYERYEVSAFARPGRQCRHNLNYWRFGDYLGIGAGAHGKVTADAAAQRILRTRKVSQPRRYLTDALSVEEETVPSRNLLFEFMMNALRLIDGASVADYETRTGVSWQPGEPTWARLVDDGLVVAERPLATALGLRYLDTVLTRLLTD